jgi:hypothetical protein
VFDYDLQGGGLRTFGRMFSCCFLSFLFVVISVILTLLMVRLPIAPVMIFADHRLMT